MTRYHRTLSSPSPKSSNSELDTSFQIRHPPDMTKCKLEPVGLGVSRSHGRPHHVVTCSRGYRIYRPCMVSSSWAHRHSIVMEDIVILWWGHSHKYAAFSAPHLLSSVFDSVSTRGKWFFFSSRPPCIHVSSYISHSRSMLHKHGSSLALGRRRYAPPGLY